ncbi:MAG TPA: UvrB/UvrC motif-containing protein [Longimicrobiales bacterium]|nr:UvrB/UvrC motif-containing protein [Longimicrobiales bacterium]
MICDNCGQAEAVVHLTQIVNNQMSTHRLCEKCAAEKGLESTPEPANFPLTDFLAQMGKDPMAEAAPADVQCSFCGLTFRDFRETGRLGCPHCYETYAPQLQRLLRRVHGGTQHVGKVYLPPDPSATDVERRLEALRRKLHRAVEAEDFERAAELRDEIRSLEPA